MAEFTRMAFSPEEGLRKTEVYPSAPSSEAEARGSIQGISDQLKDYINDKLLAELQSVTTNDSGADKIGSAAIANLEGATVREQVSSLNSRVTSFQLGAIADNTITNEKLNQDIKIGSLAALNTAEKGSVVGGVNEIAGGIGSGSMTTTAETLKGAVNELNAKVIDTDQIAQSAVKEGNIDTDAVTETKIKDGAVTADKLSSDAITADKIPDGAITTNKIADGAVTKSKTSGWFGWTPVVNSQKLSANANTLTITSMAGYSEILIQIKDGSSNTSYVRGSIAVPLGSDGIPQPAWIYLMIENSTPALKPRWFKFINNITISYGGAGDTPDDEYITIYAR